MVMLVIFLICFSTSTVVHLFYYRYRMSAAFSSSPRWHIIGIGFYYLFGGSICLSFIVVYEDPYLLIQRLYMEYSCIPKEILQMVQNEQAMVYDQRKLGVLLCFPAITFFFFVLMIVFIFIFLTRRTLSRSSMSRRLALLQRKFLFHLILQISVPLILVLIPATMFLYIIAAEVYGYFEFGMAFLGSMSLYGSTGAIVLIIVNPPYWKWLPNLVNSSNQGHTPIGVIPSSLK